MSDSTPPKDGNGKGKGVQKPEDEDSGSGFLASVATSASTLASSLLTGPPSSLHKDLSQLSSSSTKSQTPSALPCPSANAFADHHSRPSSSAAPGFRTTHQQPSAISGALPLEQEFQSFVSGSGERAGWLVGDNEFATTSPQTGTFPAHINAPVLLPDDGAGVLELLDRPGSIEDIWEAEEAEKAANTALQNEIPRQPLPNLNHPLVQKFIECEDVVEFLDMAPAEDWAYQEEVWGDLVGLVREAKREVKEEKVEERTGTNRDAVERLRQVWGHLRASKL